MFSAKKLLIANRGAIVSRISRTARRMGWVTVGLVAEDDRSLPYLKDVDEIYSLGDGDARETFLCVDRILAIAKKAKVTAIHPGYGFLSETADFAQAVEEVGFLFVGPTSQSLRKLGNKKLAKILAQQCNVPVIPGIEVGGVAGPFDSPEFRQLHFPLLVKAQSGGGGRGMRIVESPAGMSEVLESASREARENFGDGSLLLERYFRKSKHIEIQVAFDGQGRGIAFGERECSVQRRHQKIIEESPSSHLSDGAREQLQDWALKICRAGGYRNVATVEFLWDFDEFLATGRELFFFLEVNARLQVEHAVTEERYAGIDLVEMQLRIAQGELFSEADEDLISKAESPLAKMISTQPSGYALECRLCAEEPAQKFKPEAGEIVHFDRFSPAVRWEIGVQSGVKVSPLFDSMIAKVIAHGETRELAIQKMHLALSQLQILGLATNRDFLIFALDQKEFVNGQHHVQIISEIWLKSYVEKNQLERNQKKFLQAALAYLFLLQTHSHAKVLPEDFRLSPGARQVVIRLDSVEIDLHLTVRRTFNGEWQFQFENHDGATEKLAFEFVDLTQIGEVVRLEFWWEGQRHIVVGAAAKDLEESKKWRVTGQPCGSYSFELGGRSFSHHRGQGISQSYHGKVLKILKKPGERVEKGEVILVMESMKMETHVSSGYSGVVTAMLCREGELYVGKQKPFEIEVDGGQ